MAEPRDRWRIDEATGCWLWTGWTDARGNPGIHLTIGMRSAPRWVWERETGRPPPPDLPLRSICRTKLCVNPRHREPGHPRRADATKITPMTGRAIRLAVDNGLSRREIARTLGVNAETVRKIVAERGR
jgi:hypothetical protein